MTGPTSFMTLLAAISHAIVAVFSFLLAKHNAKHDKKLKKERDLSDAKKELTDVCDNGSISDLIDITQKIRDINNNTPRDIE